jgi:hypothetical protein
MQSRRSIGHIANYPVRQIGLKLTRSRHIAEYQAKVAGLTAALRAQHVDATRQFREPASLRQDSDTRTTATDAALRKTLPATGAGLPLPVEHRR